MTTHADDHPGTDPAAGADAADLAAFASAAQAARRARRMSVDELARAADVGRDAVASIEAGDAVDDHVRRSVASVLGIEAGADDLPVPLSPAHASLIRLVHQSARERDGFAVFGDPAFVRAAPETSGPAPGTGDAMRGADPMVEDAAAAMRSLVVSFAGMAVSAVLLLVLYGPLVRLGASDGGQPVASVVAAAGGMALAMLCLSVVRDARAVRGTGSRAGVSRAAASAAAEHEAGPVPDLTRRGHVVSPKGIGSFRVDGANTARRWVDVGDVYSVTVRMAGPSHADVEVGTTRGMLQLTSVRVTGQMMDAFRGWAAPREGAAWRTVLRVEPAP